MSESTDILCVLCRRPMANTHRSVCESCVPPDESEIVATSKLEKSLRETERLQREVESLKRACDEQTAARKELVELVREFADPDPCRYDHNGRCQAHWLNKRPCPNELARKWLAQCETCQDEGQVQLTDEGGNRAWWPCPACRPNT